MFFLGSHTFRIDLKYFKTCDFTYEQTPPKTGAEYKKVRTCRPVIKIDLCIFDLQKISFVVFPSIDANFHIDGNKIRRELPVTFVGNIKQKASEKNYKHFEKFI